MMKLKERQPNLFQVCGAQKSAESLFQMGSVANSNDSSWENLRWAQPEKQFGRAQGEDTLSGAEVEQKNLQWDPMCSGDMLLFWSRQLI